MWKCRLLPTGETFVFSKGVVLRYNLRHRLNISIMRKIFIIGILLVAVGISVFWPLVLSSVGVDKEDMYLVYKYLEIILSLPSVILIIFSALLFRFGDEIQDILKNLSVLKVWGVQVEKGDIRKGDDEEKVQGESKKVASEIVKEGGKHAEKLIQEYNDLLEHYYFKYLDASLAHDTKRALLFFKERSVSIAEFFYHFSLHQRVYNPEHQKRIMLDVLLEEGLLIKNGDIVSISDKGKRFLQFIGW